jgi:hypothetical protein
LMLHHITTPHIQLYTGILEIGGGNDFGVRRIHIL